MAKILDYDALLKDFVTDFFQDFVAFVSPELYEAIDWTKGYTFLEQELINAFRGKWKIKGKRRHTDKLVKVQLKTGKEHYIFVHIEFQHNYESDFARRMYEYRAIAGLRYGIEEISAFAVFTDDPPPVDELLYERRTYGTILQYQFTSIVAVSYPEQLLIDASDNPFAIALLAAQYTHQSKGDEPKRLELKNKLFELARAKNIPFDRIVKILNFVRDFIDLSPEFENEFQQTQYFLVFPNSDDMTISQGSKDFAAGLYEHVFGINPLTEVEKERQKAARERQRAQEEHQRAEEERQRAEEQRQQAEEQRQHTRAAILNLYQTLHLEPALIATIFEISEQEVLAILEAAE
jgi:hypothetical protein